MNEITVLVAPATRPGWYMYYNMGCGGGVTSPGGLERDGRHIPPGWERSHSRA